MAGSIVIRSAVWKTLFVFARRIAAED